MAIDPITVEIIRCALKAAANEMSVVLKKTAYNMMIYEVQDYCVSIVDHEGRTMSQNEGALPIFLADLGVAVQDGVESTGWITSIAAMFSWSITRRSAGSISITWWSTRRSSGSPSSFASWRCARTGSTSVARAPASDQA